MSKTAAWFRALRLRTLPLSLSGIIMGSASAYHQGFWDRSIFGLALITTILFQIVSNLANDLGDGMKGTDNEHRIGPERAVQSGIISQKAMKNAVIFTSILSFLSASMLIYVGVQGMPVMIGGFYLILALISIAAAIGYTVGKKAYGYFGMGDLMVLLFFGFVSVLGVYSLYAKSFLSENILLAVCVGLLSTSVLNLNNMRDHQNDARSGKRTLVVQMGPNRAKLYHVLLILIALSSFGLYIAPFTHAIMLIFLVPISVLLMHVFTALRIQHPKAYDPELKKVALSTFLLSILFFIVLIYLTPAPSL